MQLVTLREPNSTHALSEDRAFVAVCGKEMPM